MAFLSPLRNHRCTSLLALSVALTPFVAALTPIFIRLPTTGIMAISDKNPSKYNPLQKYIIALIASNASPITGTSPAQSKNV